MKIIIHPTLACDINRAVSIGNQHDLELRLVRGQLIYREKIDANNLPANMAPLRNDVEPQPISAA